MGNVRMRAEQINYGASNVKVALDDLGPKDLIALSARMDTIEAWKATVKAEEKTGASVEFTNALALAAVSLSAEIEASQDLHGYDHPWAGGAGKNKLNVTLANIKLGNSSGTWSGNIYTYQGLNFEPVFDNGGNFKHGKVTGTATALTQFYVNYEAFTPSGNFILNGCPNGGSYSTFDVRTNSDNDAHADCVDIGSGVAVNRTETGLWAMSVVITVRSGYNCGSGIIFKPMLRLSTESDASFAPYSNICPISGRTSVTITDYDSESNTATVTIQLGTTVYGGTLNVTTGVLTVKTAKVDMGDLQWGYNSNVNRFYATVADGKYTGSDVGMTGRCSCYAPVAVNWRNLNSGEITFGTSFISGSTSTIVVCDTAYTDATAFKTAVTGQTVCYELATPQTIQLTPAQLTMLKGYNRLSSDGGGEITVEAYTGAPWGGDE